MEITLTVTPSLNKLFSNKHAKSNYRKKYKRELNGYAHFAPKEKTKMQVVITRFGSRMLDRDNLIGGCKPLLDEMKSAGLIVDDREEWLIARYYQEKVARGYEKTEIDIRAV